MVSATAESHPRFSARRAAVERHGERRKWVRTGVLLLPLVAAIAALGLARTPALDVDAVAIEGATRADSPTLESLVGIDRGIALIDVDLAAVEQRVERHPWVADAQASRDWPGTLRVEVTERTPVAVAPVAEATYLVLDLEGVVLDVVAGRPPSLPLVRGVEIDAAPGQRADGLSEAVRVVDAMPADLEAWVVGVTEGTERDVVLELVDGVPAQLGTTEGLADKLVALATLLTRVDSACIESFNVAAPEAPVVTRCRTVDPQDEGEVASG